MRILLIRTSALGDVVQALPALRALRRHRPEAVVGWLVEEAYAPLLAGHPDLDDLLAVRLRPWRTSLLTAATAAEAGRFAARLRAFRADVALDLMGNHKAALLARLSGAPRRVGLAGPFRREPASAAWLSERVAPAGEHAVERSLAPLAALGVPAGEIDFGGELILPAARPDPGAAPYFLLHPGAAWGNKRYPPERWGEVARLLGRRSGLPTRVSYGPGEEALAAAVVAAAAGAALPQAAADLPGLVAAIRGARLVLAGDTGPLHLARALGTPVLGLFGPTDPERHGPYGQPQGALAHRLPCSFCHRRFGDAKACLLALTPDAVAARAGEILAS